MVHPAHIQDRDGGVLLLSTLFGMYPFLAKLFADAGYQGPQFATAVAKVLPYLSIEIVKRSDQANGFVVLPMRWVVERTLAWLNRCRRLAKDFENLNRNALAFLQLTSSVYPDASVQAAEHEWIYQLLHLASTAGCSCSRRLVSSLICSAIVLITDWANCENIVLVLLAPVSNEAA